MLTVDEMFKMYLQAKKLYEEAHDEYINSDENIEENFRDLIYKMGKYHALSELYLFASLPKND